MMTNGTVGGNEEHFARFITALKHRYGEAAFASWFSDLAVGEVSEDKVTLTTASQTRADLMRQRYRPGMLATWNEIISPTRRLDIIARSRMSEHAASIDANAARSAMPRTIGVRPSGEARSQDHADGARATLSLSELASDLDPSMTLEGFAVDASNRFAFAAAEQVFVEDAPRDIIYIHGPSGSGKSHILNGICHRWSQEDRGPLAYITYNNITNGYVSAVMSNNVLALQKDLLARKLLVIDDIHLLVGKNRTQEEILNLLNAFAGGGRQLVIAGEFAPARLAESGINQRLADRLAGGIAVPIMPGGEDLRREVLKKRIDQSAYQCVVSDEAIDFVAANFPFSMREAIGALKQLLLVFGREDKLIGADDALEVLRGRLADRPRAAASFDQLIEATADAFDLKTGEILGRAQPQRIVRARHAFVFVAREYMGESFPRISAFLKRDHTTAISSYRRAQALHEREEAFRSRVRAIRATLCI